MAATTIGGIATSSTVAAGADLHEVEQGGVSKKETNDVLKVFMLNEPLNAQTGTSYTYVNGDNGKFVTHSNASAIAGTLPQAGASFPAGWWTEVKNIGAGTLTITPTTSTIDGAASLVLTTGQGVTLLSNGTNYFTLGREKAITAGTTAQYWRGDKTWSNLAADVLAVLLTGLSTATATAVVAADSILVGIGKLQAQVNAKLDATANAVSAAKLNTPRNINGVAFDGTADITIADSTKEPTITGGTVSQFWAGTKVFRDLATDVGAVVLTGLSTATATAVTATDSILVGIGKLQAQLNSFSTTALRGAGSVSSASGVVTIDLASGNQVFNLTLTENVTSWTFSNTPASGKVSEIRIVIKQGASTAYTCVSPATSGNTAGGAWVMSSTLNATESLGIATDSSGTRAVFPSGVYA